MKLSTLATKMREYNGRVADNSECDAWKDFAGDAYKTYGAQPLSARADEIDVIPEFANYWSDVTNCDSLDYDKNGATT